MRARGVAIALGGGHLLAGLAAAARPAAYGRPWLGDRAGHAVPSAALRAYALADAAPAALVAASAVTRGPLRRALAIGIASDLVRMGLIAVGAGRAPRQLSVALMAASAAGALTAAALRGVLAR